MRIKHVLCAAAGAAVLCAASAAMAEAGDRYIVKYNEYGLENYAADRSFPFDFVDGEGLNALIGADALEWYEGDEEIPLPDAIEPDAASLLSSEDSADVWNIEMTRARAACESGYMGQGVRVAVVDTGVNRHEALGDRVAEGYNYIRDNNDTEDTHGHGTSVAGLIAGCDGTDQIGTAPGAEIVPLKCFNGSSGSSIMICRAVLEAVREFDCGVINLSICLRDATDAMEEAVAYAEEHGVCVVAAAGNDGTDKLRYPAAYESVIGVGALRSTGLLADCSNCNTSVFLTAPGEAVRSIGINGGFRYCTGTSFSAPMAAGAIADMLSADPSLTPKDIRRILSAAASDAGSAGYDRYFGWGILDVRGCIYASAMRPECFISAPYEAKGSAALRLTNNTEDEKACDLYAVEYTGSGAVVSVNKIPLLLAAEETREIIPERISGRRGYFLFKSGTQEPLSPAWKPG